MHLAQVLHKLRREGFQATKGRVYGALRHGYLRPRPQKRARGAYHFTSRHLAQLRWYFVHVRPGPPPARQADFPVCGYQDRLHRLQRKKDRKTWHRETLVAIRQMEQLAERLQREKHDRVRRSALGRRVRRACGPSDAQRPTTAARPPFRPTPSELARPLLPARTPHRGLWAGFSGASHQHP